MAEVWKNINGFEQYQVSSLGNIKNKGGKLKSVQTTKNGYSQVLLWIGHKAKGVFIHRMVAEAFIPNPENKTDVNHIDGNKANNRVENLEWCTRSENLRHAYKNNLRVASNQKLTLDEVKEIKLNQDKLSRKELAKKFNVSYWTICDIFQNKSFREV